MPDTAIMEVMEVIHRADIANTKPASPCADCGGEENPHYVQRIEVFNENTETRTTAWLCCQCQSRNRDMDLESTLRVNGCHRCGGSEYAARTFTLNLRKWLCQKCLDRISQGGKNDQALLKYASEVLQNSRS